MSRSNTPVQGHPVPQPQAGNAPRHPQGHPAPEQPFAQQQAHYPPSTSQAPAQWPPQQPVAPHAQHGAMSGTEQSYYYQQQAAPPVQQTPLYQPAAATARPADPYRGQPAANYAAQPAPQSAAQWPPQQQPHSQRPTAPDAARYFAPPQHQVAQPQSTGRPSPSPMSVDALRNGRPTNAAPSGSGQARNFGPGPAPQAPQWASDQRMGEPSLDFGNYGAGPATAPPAQSGQRGAPHPGFHDGNQPFPQNGYQPAHQVQYGHPAQQHAHHDDGQHEAYDDEEIIEEEPRRGRRGLLVAAALIGAIGLGGSLAYVYKSYGGAMMGGKPPLLKADAQPPKAKPATPGGKEFPNADRKIFGRLGEDGGQQPQQQAGAAASAVASVEAQPDGAPRKVQIIPIAPASPPPSIQVPGMTVENVGPPPGARALPPVVPASPAPPVAAPQAVAPKVVARAAPPSVATVAAAEAAPPPAPLPRKPAPKAPTQEAAAPANAGVNGFVAVLSSQKSRMDALKVYADIQQKFGQVLSNKPADVQEANLGEKGVYYRAVVGPPGSRDAASNLCVQLKAAGFSGCWVTAY